MRPAAGPTRAVRGFSCPSPPTYASWINQVERWFATLTERQLRRGTHRSPCALAAAIRLYLAVYNEDPTPFV